MSLLVDRELQNLIDPAQAQPPLPLPLPPALAAPVSRDIGRWNTQIQPASLDLTIGRIMLPPEDKSSDTQIVAEPYFALGVGKTAIIETREDLSVPPTLAGIGFPPSSVSLEGLLMTNPGHIDPGYHGKLKFTLINMGRQPYPLVGGDLICTVLFFRVAAPQIPYNQLDPTGRVPAPPPPNDPDRDLRRILRQLSPDMLSVDERVKDETSRQSLRSQISVPIVSGIIVVAITIITSIFTNAYLGVNDLRLKIEGLAKSTDLQQTQTRIEKLENQQSTAGQLNDLKARIEKLETHSNQTKSRP
jgi:dCTP deaminase